MNERNKHMFSRRAFMKVMGAGVTAPMILPRSVFGANDKLNLAWVGIGGKGWGDLRSSEPGNHVVALAEVDPGKRRRAKQSFPEAKLYTDFRVMLEEMGDSIDAVGISTPDHTHFAAAYMAMSMGKHVFVQKPLAHSIGEVRALQELAKQKNLVTQMGNQGHASEGARLVKEWYEAGLIGEVKEVVAWTNRPKAGFGFNGIVQTAFPPVGEIPAGLDWDQWLGPCGKEIGYSREFHPAGWRRWWDFGCGGLGDIGCHTIDTAYWALGLGAPDRVDVEMNEAVNPIFTPNGSVVSYSFPARGKQPAVTLKWYEGPTAPPLPEGYDQGLQGEGGLIIVGENGGICHHDMRPTSPRLYPEARWQDYKADKEQRVPKTLPRIKGGIHGDWLAAIRNGTKACSDFSYSAPLTEAILLGGLAIRTGEGLGWNSDAMKISGNEAAARLVPIEAREGWRPEDLNA